MNIKRFFIASIVVFIAVQITDPIIHGVFLGKAYEATKSVWRADMDSKMWIMILSSLLFSFLFVYIFIKGYEKKGLLEGIRFGILLGLLMNLVGILNQYVVYPVPFSLAIQWFLYGMIQYIIYGIIAALVYKPKKYFSI